MICKPDLISRLAESLHMDETQVQYVLDGFFHEVISTLEKRDKVKIVDFGSFFMRPYAGRSIPHFKFGIKQYSYLLDKTRHLKD